ncbi:hypothetical protein IFR05_006377 [Cadophora sp. M221]|nr:hypothetical protein IFR05_006377 [Cadophora sp. M221]
MRLKINTRGSVLGQSSKDVAPSPSSINSSPASHNTQALAITAITAPSKVPQGSNCQSHSIALAISTQDPTFLKLGKLPFELRLIIWNFAGRVGQVIGVRVIVKRGKPVFIGTAARCPLLLACKESRAAVMKWKDNFNAFLREAPKIYANSEVDMIWI